jgi:hypothetical protein
MYVCMYVCMYLLRINYLLQIKTSDIKGMILYVIEMSKLERSDRTLMTIRDALVQHTKNGINEPKDHIIYQMAVK